MSTQRRVKKPKINFITYDLPYPLTSGGKIRAYYLLKALSQDYDITLFSHYRKDSQKKHFAFLKSELGLTKIKLYRRRWVWHPFNLLKTAFSLLPLLSVSYLNKKLGADLVNAYQQQPEAIFHFESFGPAVFLPLLKKRGAICVLGNENVEWKIYDKTAKREKSFLKYLMRLDVLKMRRLEHLLYQLADFNIGVSQSDCQYTARVSGKKCYLVKNGVDVEKLSKISPPREEAICFGGDLVYQQNADALSWFLKKVLPHMERQVSVKIVTLTKPGWLNRFNLQVFADPDIFAPEIYAQASVFVAPIRVGGGTNIKILEAMAVKTPVVTTSRGADPLGAESGRHLLVANTAEEFSSAVDKLLRSEKLRDRIAANGYQFVSQNYSWQTQSEKIRQIYQNRIIAADS